MGELKPIGSEKLQGNDKLKRILELTYYNTSDNSKKMSEIVVESTSGIYGIVKEKDGFYVKKGLTEGSLDYIGGLFMKNKNKFTSYAEAFKKLEFLVEQEKLQEATKYVLKTPKPQQEAPMPEPTDEMPPVPAPSTPEDETQPPVPGDEMTSDPSGELPTDDENDYLKIVQSAAGKLQQKLRKYEDKLKSEDIKAALMQVLSAIDPEKQLEDKDKEEIIGKFEPEEDEVPTDDSNIPTPPDEGEIEEDSIDGMAALEELIMNPFDDDYSGLDDDDFDDEPLDFDDKRARSAAERDMKSDFDDDDEDEIEGTTDEYDPDEEETDEQIMSTSELPEPESLPSEPTAQDNLDVRELDVNELTSALSTSVKETLSKYFE